MAWDANGTNQYAQFTMNATLKAAPGGPFTFGSIMNLDSTADGAPIHFLDGTSGRHFLEIFSTYNFGTAAAAKSGPAGVTGAWYHVILTKATGNVVPEYTVTPLATGIPVSGICTGGNLGNGAAPGAAGVIQIFRWGTSATEWVDGKVEALWAHASYMNQAAREALTTWALTVTACQGAGAGWAVRLDTLSTITDATGLGGDETARFGTSPFTLVAGPSGSFFGGGGSTVNATMAATLASPAATAIATVRHPAQLVATLASPAATIVAKVRVPAVLAATLAPPTATVVAKVRVPALLAATLASPGATMLAKPRVHAVLLATLSSPGATAQALARVHATLSATLPGPVATIVKDVTPYAGATLTAGAASTAILSAGVRVSATLAPAGAATATLIASTL